MKSPEFFCCAGHGHFSFCNSSVETPFMLYRNPYWVGVIAEGGFSYRTASSLFHENTPVLLKGTLHDGRHIEADALHLSRANPPASIEGFIDDVSEDIEFTVKGGVRIGQAIDSPTLSSEYRMTGCFKGNIEITYDGWEISTISCPEPDIAKDLVQKWRVPVEGMVLQLKRDDASMIQHQDFARIVMTLLSLAQGTGVTCYRQSFTWADNELEIWRQWTGDEIGPGAIIPDHQLAKFLEQSLPAWLSLSHDQQKALRLALHYINLSARGYLDTRLLQIVQTWEFLVDAWRVKGNLSEAESCLLSRLKDARKQWNRDYPNCEVNGFWGSRISSIFDWPKQKDAIIQLASSFGLDFSLVGVDFDALIAARNSVAHSGKLVMHPTGSSTHAWDLLEKGQYCLQLLILRMLKYQGTVNHSRYKILTIMDIEEALKTVRT